MQRGAAGSLRLVRRRLVGGRLAALGAAGVVIGHTLAYLTSEPDGQRRASLLQETGHSYWHAAVVAAVVAGTCSIVAHAVRQFRSARSSAATTETIRRAGARLGLFQVCVYAVM